MTGATTCGPLYKAGLEFFTRMDPDLTRVYAAGFVSGQAEKIYLGACKAAMFRPSNEWLPSMRGIVGEVAGRYGLRVAQVETSNGVEIWLCADDHTLDRISNLPSLGENSPLWHNERGTLCGVPRKNIDFGFHNREGWGQRCD